MGVDSAITIPTTITSKADFDKWLDNEVGDKLTTTQKNTLKTDISAKLGLDMGNAITAYGRAEINKDLQYVINNPNATSIPNLDADPKIGDANGPNQFNALWARANQFSDPFLIDLTSVLALMHETSEKLRSATKELREAENLNQQAQMQAAADNIHSQGVMQAIAGAVGATMSIAGGAMGVAGASKGMAGSKDLHTDVKALKTEFSTPDISKTLSPPRPTTSAPLEKPKLGDNGPKSVDTSKSKTVDSPKKAQDKENLKAELNDLKEMLNKGQITKEDFNARVNNSISQFSNNKFQGNIQLQNQYWQSYGQMLDGVGKAMGASFNGVASGFEHAKAIDDKEAAQAGFEKEQTSELVKTLSDFSQQIRQTVAAIIQSQDQAAQRVANV